MARDADAHGEVQDDEAETAAASAYGGAVPAPPPVGGARRGLWAAVVALVLSGAIAFAGWVAFGDDGEVGGRAARIPWATGSPAPEPSGSEETPSGGGLPAPGQESGAPTASPSADPPGSQDPSESQDPSASQDPSGSPGQSPSAAPSASPPTGFHTEDDPAGFALAVPDGWGRTVEGPSVFYTSPDQDTRLQIFELHGPESTPYESAREAERLASRQRGYERITLERTGQGEMDPVELEYTYDSEKYGGPRHILDHRFAAPDGTMYAVLVIGPDDDRAGQQETLRAALDSFHQT
ncbi:serine/arginine repetitive matrix protein 2 [Streptomyces cuspidosporus]|uniref:Serine/arginine repetitive matrix protein 2 n=1 Tax=Streptomyces cuspidosporus TaxID=66882 RepID=A0ABN3H1S3_9ACTN